jgi:hypothetical protein
MTETELLIAEVRQLRVDVARLHAGAHPARLDEPLFKDLSTNPYTQYKVHMWGAIYWLINFPLICCLFFFTPTLWLKLGIFITLIYSIYANLATDYGAMSAAEAAFGEPQLPPIPLEPPPLPPI